MDLHSPALVAYGFARKIMEDKSNVDITESSEVSYDSLSALLEELISMDLDARITRFPQLPRNRADILPAGIAVILELMGILNARIYIILLAIYVLVWLGSFLIFKRTPQREHSRGQSSFRFV